MAKNMGFMLTTKQIIDETKTVTRRLGWRFPNVGDELWAVKKAMGLSFPILHDSDYQVGLTYGARTLPMTYVIDRQGIIRQRVFGARDWNSQEARTVMRTLLQEPYHAPSERM